MEKWIDDFAQPAFVKANKQFYDRYIKLRVHGYPAKQSFLRVFGPENWGGEHSTEQHGYERIEAIESTTYYLEQFDKVLEETSVSKLWNAKTSIHSLLKLVRDPYVKPSTQLNAQKELNVLAGIVVIDENGKTKAGRSLEDFYAGVSTTSEVAAG
jgi:hypothetical protein